MAGEWRASTWGEEISLEYGKSLRDYDKASGKYRVFGSNGPIGWTDKPLASGPGVILGRKGAYRGIEFSRTPFFVIDTAYYVVPKSELDMRWLYYAIKYHKLGDIDDGSPIPSTTRSAVYVRDFDVPPLAEQKAIAAMLGALDDKIELNRRMNATLEAMARVLFQSWFVDFDPVRAKLDGRKPAALDPATAALFPDSFQESSLGPIPHGWTADTIKNRASIIQYGFTQSATKEPVGPHFLRITDISGGRIDWASVPFCQATDEEREKYRILDGDIFIARTGASTGDNIYAVEPPPAVFASYLIRLQFRSRGLGRLVGEFTRTPDYASYVAGNIGGSAQPNASAQTLASAAMVFPTEDIADAFYRTVRPLDLMRAANDRESRTLATLRDTLLPKLLSGELSITVPETLEGIQ